MFKKNQKQYINTFIQNDKIIIHYRIINNNKIIKHDKSIFMLSNNNMPQDGAVKLKLLQEAIPVSYLSALYDISDQEIITTSQRLDSDKSCEFIKLDNNVFLKTKKTGVIKKASFFKQSGVDYLISPFIILNKLIQTNPVSNSLNIFIDNNMLYALILNKDNKITYGKIIELTPYDNIASSQFANSEDVKQKLYNEIYFLEIQQQLSDLVQTYYQSDKDIDFLTKTNIYCTAGQLNDDHLDQLQEALMTITICEEIDIEEILNMIVMSDTVMQNSFVEPRKKDNENKKLFWISIVLASLFMVIGILYFKLTVKEETTVQKQVVQQHKAKNKKKRFYCQIILKKTIK